ncbi:hypothetical protein A3K63_03200 [Candidatus Micrarchaeota archaeon RBG_16_49_10]|nr:MAG: hypothetical protein A3K63_03200 [Candidatus Micrarchaeota archaeon RBG_16_49_10]
MDLESVTVGERGQVVIPQRFREEIGINPREKMMAIRIDSLVVYKKMEDFLTESLIKTLQKGLGDLKFEDIESSRDELSKEMIR